VGDEDPGLCFFKQGVNFMGTEPEVQDNGNDPILSECVLGVNPSIAETADLLLA